MILIVNRQINDSHGSKQISLKGPMWIPIGNRRSLTLYMTERTSSRSFPTIHQHRYLPEPASIPDHPLVQHLPNLLMRGPGYKKRAGGPFYPFSQLQSTNGIASKSCIFTPVLIYSSTCMKRVATSAPIFFFRIL